MKRKVFNITFPAILLTSSLLCLNCGKTYKIEFDLEHCTSEYSKSINVKNDYSTTFTIDNGYELLIKNIEVNNNGNIDNDCWTFMYQSNLVNIFKIKANTIKGDVKVTVKCTGKHIYEYGCAVDVTEVDQDSIAFTPTKKIKYISDWQREAYPLNVDEELNFSFKAIEGKTLPTNIGMWMNGRYAKEGVEVTFTYSNNNTECQVHVPPFVAKDNLQFRCK